MTFTRARMIVGICVSVLALPAGAQRQVNLKALHWQGLNGTPLNMQNAEGKALLVNFWAPWCGPCREEIPWFQELQQSGKDRVVVIGVVADPDEYARAQTFMKQQHVTYRLARLTPQLERTFGAPAALPETFYLSPLGVIVHAVQGVAPHETVLQFLRDAESTKEVDSAHNSTVRTALAR